MFTANDNIYDMICQMLISCPRGDPEQPGEYYGAKSPILVKKTFLFNLMNHPVPRAQGI